MVSGSFEDWGDRSVTPTAVACLVLSTEHGVAFIELLRIVALATAIAKPCRTFSSWPLTMFTYLLESRT